MPKLSSLVSLGTAGKVAGGIVAGGLSTVAVQRYMDSSEFSKDPQRAEMREEGRKKLDFEIQQQSEELEKKKRELEALAETIAKQQAALKEERSAVQQMQQAATQVVASEVPVVETVQQVAQVEESEEPKSEESKKAEVPTEYVSRKPQVFDGGNKEKPVATTNDASKSTVAFGSSGDVVTVGNADNAEMIDRLRKEIEDLRRRLAEKDGSPKEEALRAREERLRERERALSEKLWKSNMQSKATQTDDALFEAASGDDDPFDFSDSKAVKKKKGGRHFASVQGTGSTSKKSKAEDPLSGMEKGRIMEYAKEEMEEAAASIDAESLARVFGKKSLSSEDAQKKKEEFCSALSASMSAPAEEGTLCSVKEALKDRTEQEKERTQGWIKTLLEHCGVKDLSTVHSVNSLASVVLGAEKAKCIEPEKYVELLRESEEKVAREMAENFEMSDAEKQETDKRRNKILEQKKLRKEKVAKKGRGEFVLPALDKVLEEIKNDAKENIAGLYDKGTRILRGYNDLQKAWGALRETSKGLYNEGAVLPPPPPPPPSAGELPGIEVPGVDPEWFNLLATADEDFKKGDDKERKPYDDATASYFKIKGQLDKLDNVAKKKKLTEDQKKKESEDLTKQLSEKEEEINKLAEKVKEFRSAAFKKKENKLLVEHQRWLSKGLPEELNVDSVVQKAKDELKRGEKQLKPWELFRARKLRVDSRFAILDEDRKKKLDDFVKGVERCKKTSEELIDKYTAIVVKKDTGINVVKMENGRYSVTGKLSTLGREHMRDCLLAIAPKIEKLTIEKFDAENASEPFTNFIELCLRLRNLKHLSVKGVFGVSSKNMQGDERGFFDKVTARCLPQRLRDCWAQAASGEALFFQVLSLIPSPGLECFEMNNVNSEGEPNDTAMSLSETDDIYAFIKSCKRVKLPVIESASMIALFDLLTDDSFRDLELCTRSFAVLMQTSGFPKALYRLLKPWTTVTWFGNPGFPKTGMEQLICSGGSGGMIPSPGDKKEVETLLRDQEIEGKKLTDWVTNKCFSTLFRVKPEVYLKLSAVHPEGFKDMLIDYNEKTLNPVYVACSRLTSFKKTGKDKNCKRREVNVTDPLKDILKQYPVFDGRGGVAFDSKLTVDGSSLREKILPALLNLVLREKIDGKNYTVVEVEDCDNDPSNTYWWCFPSPVNDKWEKEKFSVCTSDGTFNSLSNNEKDKLVLGAMNASDALAGEAGTWKNIKFKWRPEAVRSCLRGVMSDRPIFYWNVFASMARTGGVRVSANVPEGKPTLFNLFDTVLNAQATHEKLYKAIEDTDAKYEERNQLETKVQKLKEEIETAEEDKPARLKRDLAKAEAELQNVEKEVEALSKKAKEYENLLQPVRKALEEALPYVKGVMNGTKKKKPVGQEEEERKPVGQEEEREGKEEKREQPGKEGSPEQSLFEQHIERLLVAWDSGGRRVKYRERGGRMTLDKVPNGRRACVDVNDNGAIKKALMSRSKRAKIEKVMEEYYLVVDLK